MAASAPPSSSEAAHARGIVSELIFACRDGEHAFERAARAVEDPVLRAELAQYSVQRCEFVAELQEALTSVSDRADGSPTTFGDHGRWESLEQAAAAHDRAAILHECESFDLTALEAYRHALQSGLPHAIDGVSHSHFYAITRVQSRLQCLADLAGGGSPIDNA